MIKVVHIITGLKVGGAETMLCKLVTRLSSPEVTHEVVSLGLVGPLGERIRQAGVPVVALNMRPNRVDPRPVLKLAKWLRRKQPDVIVTWLYHADLVGGIANKLAGDFPLAWNVRRSFMDRETLKRSTFFLGRLCCRLSHVIPHRILCCSKSGMEEHVRLGYDSAKMEIIPNGFDTEIFRPNPSARTSVREELGLPENTLLIGMLGRYHPMKDHENLIHAATMLVKAHPDVHFVCAGANITWQNPELAHRLRSADLCSNFHLLGTRADIPTLTAALDVATLSSRSGEGFPNVIGEAMACGIPCVVTDVGDSGYIVGETGVVVAARSPVALQSGWERLLALPLEERYRLGAQARLRIQTEFSLDAIVTRYEQFFKEMVHE
ncbi:MAG: putative Phosphatidylinositol alpha-mannosyltransferase [Chthonomonadaceae bacterium]|nr:putative Phosphatidylinositol alpha-mannosyltransferase [Chthonomonadaceae bacterium]